MNPAWDSETNLKNDENFRCVRRRYNWKCAHSRRSNVEYHVLAKTKGSLRAASLKGRLKIHAAYIAGEQESSHAGTTSSAAWFFGLPLPSLIGSIIPRKETIPNPGSRALVLQRTYRGSFSAVSKPVFESKWEFPISQHSMFFKFHMLVQDLRTFAPLRAQNLRDDVVPLFCKKCANFPDFGTESH